MSGPCGVLVLLLGVGACDQPTRTEGEFAAVRDTLGNGAVVVRYPALPDSGAQHVAPELRIGAIDGDPNLAFGDVRGIEADSGGTIYVLDYQASEIRTFDAEGQFIEQIAGRGEGPGEISESNGMILIGDTLLWVQDHSRWQMLALRLDGSEIARVAMHVRNYGYMWNGTVDAHGRFWKPVNHSDEAQRPFPPELGLQESLSRRYFVSLDPSTETRDSVFIGIASYREHVSRTRTGGYIHQGVPFQWSTVMAVDPEGGIWVTRGADYTIARLAENGDTVLVIEADMPGPVVSEEDRADFIAGVVERDETRLRAAEALADAMPMNKPAISGLLMDDAGNLWVRRGGTEENHPHYDLFSRDGDYLRSVVLDFTPSKYLPVKLRNGKLYALLPDELGVPFVVRAAVTY